MRAAQQRRLASIAPSGTVWEATVYSVCGGVPSLIYGSLDFIGRALLQPHQAVAEPAGCNSPPRLLLHPKQAGDTNVIRLSLWPGAQAIASHLNAGQLRAEIRAIQEKLWTTARVANSNASTATEATPLTSPISWCSLRATLRRIARREGASTT